MKGERDILEKKELKKIVNAGGWLGRWPDEEGSGRHKTAPRLSASGSCRFILDISLHKMD